MEYSTNEMKTTLYALGKYLISLQDELTELDSKLGDGDLGVSMNRGGTALCCATENFSEGTADILLSQCAAAFNRAAPSTLGTLLSMGLYAIANEIKGQRSITDTQVAAFPRVLAREIARKGKAKAGDKTILDALLPYADALEKRFSEGKDLQTAAKEAAREAQKGAEETKGMMARTGRARWLGERNKEYPDGGAVLCARITAFLVEGGGR